MTLATTAAAAPAPVAVPKLAVTVPSHIALTEISERTWIACCVAVLIISAAIRVYGLELKPMHHDEGVNGFFMSNLVHQGVYRYDPSNYHGPTLYYLALPTTALFGLGTFALRMTTVIFGIGIVWLILGLRRQLGALATLIAATLTAVSPAAVFYSRYFIHETIFVFFTLGVVVAAVRFYETGRVVFVAAGSISAALLFATKETAFVSLITLVLALMFSQIWIRKVARPAAGVLRKRSAKSKQDERLSVLLAKLGSRERLSWIAGLGIVFFVFVNIVFYSSFFTNGKGVNDAISALTVWSKTGTSEFHGKPFDTYLKWLGAEELPILFLAIAGSAVALLQSRINRFAIFIGAWAFGMLAAYSLIPYKTPWLGLNFIVPMAIIGGYAVPVIANRWNNSGQPLLTVALVGGLAISVCAYQTLVLNFRNYDNDAYPYVYAHTSRDLHALVAEVERLAARAGRTDIGISVASPDYWPLPWYFRENHRVGFAGSIASSYEQNETPLVIGRESDDPNQDQRQKLREVLGSNYQQVGSYTLRPGVRLALFARTQLLTP